MRFSIRWAAACVTCSLGAAVVGCGSKTAGGGAADFVGTWSCTVTVAGSPSAETIVVVENADGSITATGAADAGLPCSLKYTPDGDTASLESGQTCTIDGTTLSLTGGTATVSGTTLTASLEVSLAGTSVTGGSYACAKE